VGRLAPVAPTPNPPSLGRKNTQETRKTQQPIENKAWRKPAKPEKNPSPKNTKGHERNARGPSNYRS
jgi:hypothetical protein